MWSAIQTKRGRLSQKFSTSLRQAQSDSIVRGHAQIGFRHLCQKYWGLAPKKIDIQEISVKMRKIIAVIAAVPIFALVAAATDVPKMETFLGYNYVRFNPNSDVFPSFNANGGGGQFVYNF